MIEAVLKLSKIALVVVTALLAGFFGLAMVFSDLGPGETWTYRILLMITLYAVFGLLTGLIFPNLWQLALLAAWGPVLFGLLAIVRNIVLSPFAALEGLIFLGPLAIVALAAYLGKRVRRRLPKG